LLKEGTLSKERKKRRGDFFAGMELGTKGGITLVGAAWGSRILSKKDKVISQLRAFFF